MECGGLPPLCYALPCRGTARAARRLLFGFVVAAFKPPRLLQAKPGEASLGPQKRSDRKKRGL